MGSIPSLSAILLTQRRIIMSTVLDKPIVLKLNRLWQRIGWCTPREAFVAMCGGIYGGTKPARGLSITTDENGELIEGVEMDWADWVKLPIRDCDFSISTGRGEIRVPSVIVCPEFEGMPVKARRFSAEGIRARDGNRCQVSGRLLKDGEGNLGHIVARAKGGSRSWENIVYMDKRLNTLQGTKLPEEMGWKLMKEPAAPKPLPANFIFNEVKQDEQKPFKI
jgi:hypothetical protein